MTIISLGNKINKCFVKNIGIVKKNDSCSFLTFAFINLSNSILFI